MYVCLATKDLTLSFPHHFFGEVAMETSNRDLREWMDLLLALCEGGFEDVGLEMA